MKTVFADFTRIIPIIACKEFNKKTLYSNKFLGITKSKCGSDTRIKKVDRVRIYFLFSIFFHMKICIFCLELEKHLKAS